MMWYKFLDTDGTAYHGGRGKWSLPVQGDDGTWVPGEWMPPIEGALVACKNGYHVSEEKDLLAWIGPACFEVEWRGEKVDAGDKSVVREARLLRRLNWDERAARLFACDCAERVVHLCGDDPRPRAVIDTARRYANGEVTGAELVSARWAWDYARASARAWAWDWDWASAWDSARASARNAERQWQTERLIEYLEVR